MRVLIVCTGNICRSPAVHAALAEALQAHAEAGEAWARDVEVDSCGLGDWHAGEAPDRRSRVEGTRRGHQVNHVARGIRPDDWAAELVVAMDHGHVTELRRRAPAGFDLGRIVLLRSFDPTAPAAAELADPYFDTDAAFVVMFDQIAAALPGLVARCRAG